MKFKKFMNLTCFLLLTVLIVACVPVKIINPYFNTTYVKIKVMPDEAKKKILYWSVYCTPHRYGKRKYVANANINFMKIFDLNSEGIKLVTKIPLEIDRNEIYRLAGVKGENKKLTSKLEQVIDEKILQAKNLIVPKALYIIKNVTEVDDEKVCFKDKSHITVKTFRKFISSIEKMAVALCTLGNVIDEEISDKNNKGLYTEALILDIIGSVAVEN